MPQHRHAGIRVLQPHLEVAPPPHDELELHEKSWPQHGSTRNGWGESKVGDEFGAAYAKVRNEAPGRSGKGDHPLPPIRFCRADSQAQIH